MGLQKVDGLLVDLDLLAVAGQAARRPLNQSLPVGVGLCTSCITHPYRLDHAASGWSHPIKDVTGVCATASNSLWSSTSLYCQMKQSVWYTFAVDVMLTGCIVSEIKQEWMYAKHC